MQGGGWCNTRRSCIFRKTTRRGSSNHMEKVLAFTGILSNKANENPGLSNLLCMTLCALTHLVAGSTQYLYLRWIDSHLSVYADFFNWNRVKLRYCDGASFTGDSQDQVSSSRLYFLAFMFFTSLKLWDLIASNFFEVELTTLL